MPNHQKYHSIHAKGGAVDDLLDPEHDDSTK